jgi:hypothetical protein
MFSVQFAGANFFPLVGCDHLSHEKGTDFIVGMSH